MKLYGSMANAYKTLPHQLINITLRKYHATENIRIVLAHHFNNIKVRVTVKKFTTA